MSQDLSKFTDEGLENVQETTSTGFRVLDSNVYNGIVKMAYLFKSAGGALGVNLTVTLPTEDNYEHTETIYITNRNGDHFFVKDGKKFPLPGFTLVNELCNLAVGLPLAKLSTETKTIETFDYKEGGTVKKDVDAITQLCAPNVAVKLGILKKKENKTVLVDGAYVPTADTRERNTIVKVWHAKTSKSYSEMVNNKEEATSMNNWLKKNQGVTKDTTTSNQAINESIAKTTTTSANPNTLFD